MSVNRMATKGKDNMMIKLLNGNADCGIFSRSPLTYKTKFTLVLAVLYIGTACKARNSNGTRSSSTKDVTVVSAEGAVYAYQKFGSDVIMRHCKDRSPVISVDDFELKCPENVQISNTNNVPTVVSNQRIIPFADLKLKLRQYFITEEVAAAVRRDKELRNIADKDLEELDRNRDATVVDLQQSVDELKIFIESFPGEDANAPALLEKLQKDLKQSQDLNASLAKFDALILDAANKIFDQSKVSFFRMSQEKEQVVVTIFETLFTSTSLNLDPATALQDVTKSRFQCKPSTRPDDKGKGLYGLFSSGWARPDANVLLGFYSFDTCKAAVNNARNNIICLPDGTVRSMVAEDKMQSFPADFAKVCLKSTRFSNPKTTCVMGSDKNSIFRLDINSNGQSPYQIPTNPDGSKMDIVSALSKCLDDEAKGPKK